MSKILFCWKGSWIRFAKWSATDDALVSFEMDQGVTQLVFFGGLWESPVSLEHSMIIYREVPDFKKGLAYSGCLFVFELFLFFVHSAHVHFLGKTDVAYCNYPAAFFQLLINKARFLPTTDGKTKLLNHEQVFNWNSCSRKRLIHAESLFCWRFSCSERHSSDGNTYSNSNACR